MKIRDALDVLDFGFDTGVNLAAMLGLLYLAGWMWPDGLLETPIAYTTPEKLLWAGGSVFVAAFAMGGLYFILLEPFVLARRLRNR